MYDEELVLVVVTVVLRPVEVVTVALFEERVVDDEYDPARVMVL